MVTDAQARAFAATFGGAIFALVFIGLLGRLLDLTGTSLITTMIALGSASAAVAIERRLNVQSD